MELNEEQLDNVLGGASGEIADENAMANEDLFRGKSIEDLKQMRGQLVGDFHEKDSSVTPLDVDGVFNQNTKSQFNYTNVNGVFIREGIHELQNGSDELSEEQLDEVRAGIRR